MKWNDMAKKVVVPESIKKDEDLAVTFDV